MPLDSILAFFAKFIETELGIVYAEHNYFQLQNRLEEIASQLAIDSLEKLFRHAQNGISGTFKQLLLDIATNNETSFFRDPRIFKAIEAEVLPSFLKANPNTSEMRIWSAASSTGQEALSLAIMLTEWNIKSPQKIDFSILGTDISDRVLIRAKQAQYSQLEIQRGLPAQVLVKYFDKNAQDRWTAVPLLTEHLRFQPQNLLGPFVFPKLFHLILCRNVLIYQNVQNKIEILRRMTEQLAPGGILILGSGESLLGLSQDYLQVSSGGAVIYLKKDFAAKAA